MLYLALAASYLTFLIEILFKSGALVILIPYGIVVPILLFIPRLVQRKLVKYYAFKPNWITVLDSLAFFIIVINAPGSIALHEQGYQYDRFIHLFCGFLGLLLVYILFLPAIKKYKVSKNKAIFILAPLAFVGTVLWECFQWSSDRLFGTHLFFDKVQPIQVDVREDIIFGCIGAAAALIFLNYNYKFFSGLVEKRRLK